MREKTRDTIGYVVTALFVSALVHLFMFLAEDYQTFLRWVWPESRP